MSDEQTLLAVIAVIYLADCLFWIPHNGLGFTHWLGKVWNIRGPSTILGNDRGALGLANPLPPLGIATRGIGWPISISERGIFSYTSAAINPSGRLTQKAAFWEWSRIEKIERDDKKILINGEHFAKGVTEYAARWIASEIARLHKLSEKKRPAEIESLIARTCDPAEVTRRVQQFAKETWLLKYVANWLFVFLFGACPYLVWKVGMVASIWSMVAGIYAQTLLIALLFWRLHRKIYPADSAQIFKPFLTMLLAAPSAIRAQDILGRPLLESFHPLAIAKALCTPKQFEELAAPVFRDLHFPRLPIVPAHANEAATNCESAFREMVIQSLRRKASVDDAKFLRAPEKTETVHTSFCPRCQQQFTDAGTTCPDCGGRPRVQF
jgi:hypothetical protein